MRTSEGFILFISFLVFPFGYSVIITITYLVFLIGKDLLLGFKSENPFPTNVKRPKAHFERDQKKRDQVLKQTFLPEQVKDETFDAIIVGSGIGGLTTGVILAKLGKRVLILEQHDQAGGCCHTFRDKGYEFDVGIHYIGELGDGQLNRTLVDQLTEGQLDWIRLDPTHDIVSIGYNLADRVNYPVVSGPENWKNVLKERFPDETVAVDEFFRLLTQFGHFDVVSGALKLLPAWVSSLAVRTRLVQLFFGYWRGKFSGTTEDVIKGLTQNKDLQTIFCYQWGDFGSPPNESHFAMQAMLHTHFLKCGSYYPVGGASEIAFNMIPIIEKAGGKVLVRAPVREIICQDGQAVGVMVEKAGSLIDLRAPLVISNAGVYNTFQRLLPSKIANSSALFHLQKSLKPGYAALNVFLGLDIPVDELQIGTSNTWAFSSNESAFQFGDYVSLSVEEAMDTEIPLLFISFPSEKDPKLRERSGDDPPKSTCTIVTLCSLSWFKKFEGTKVKKRGDEYEEIKNTLGQKMVDQACKLFPKMSKRINYVEIGTPLTTQHYIGQPHGEIYGLDHGRARFDPGTISKLRPQTEIPGLYLTGQDVMLCGFTGALFGGVLCASAVLGRNLMDDIEDLHAQQYPDSHK
eukprot:snap_masked-scaffold122_size333723-processed-gene-2.17 protein:Tk04126 transcript:snap_masked-scaffold122_size333723-processed-gene-2.17-mRNA-1 annotation:"hypothetical protein BRAFLDRAFT_119025"